MTANAEAFDLEFEPMLSLWAQARSTPAPEARVVDAVLHWGSEVRDGEDGLTAIDLGEAGVRAMIRGGFSRFEVERARDLTLIWDPRDEQLVRVLDRAALRPGPLDAPRLSRRRMGFDAWPASPPMSACA